MSSGGGFRGQEDRSGNEPMMPMFTTGTGFGHVEPSQFASFWNDGITDTQPSNTMNTSTSLEEELFPYPSDGALNQHSSSSDDQPQQTSTSCNGDTANGFADGNGIPPHVSLQILSDFDLGDFPPLPNDDGCLNNSSLDQTHSANPALDTFQDGHFANNFHQQQSQRCPFDPSDESLFPTSSYGSSQSLNLDPINEWNGSSSSQGIQQSQNVQDVYAPQATKRKLDGREGLYLTSPQRPLKVSRPSTPNTSLSEDPESGGHPIRRFVKPAVSKLQLSRAEYELLSAHREKPTGTFRGYFGSSEAARRQRDVLCDMHHKDRKDCTSRNTDRTFPQTPEDSRRLVKLIFAAIMDWSDYSEWTQAVDVDVREAFIERIAEKRVQQCLMTREAADGDDMSISQLNIGRDELEEILPSLEKQQKKVLSRDLNDQTAEWLSWGLLDAAIDSQQGITHIPPWCTTEGA